MHTADTGCRGTVLSCSHGEAAASAQSRPLLQGVFTYDRHAHVETIYVSPRRNAESLCTRPGIPCENMGGYEDACIASVVKSGVNRPGRASMA